MKNIFFVLFSFCVGTLFGINGYSIGDKLYVWAEGGLTLRENEGVQSKALLIIPYSSSVEMLSEFNSEKKEKAKIIDEGICVDENGKTIKTSPLFIHGNWAKVKYKGKIGYVFDGFLSHLRVVDNFLGFFQKNYKLLEADTSKSYNQIFRFANGHSFAHEDGDGACWVAESVMFYDISLEEALLLIRNKCKESSGKQPIYMLKYKSIIDADMYFVELAPFGVNGTISLKYSGNIAQISYDDHT